MGKRVLTTEEFIDRSIKIHNNKYDYSLVQYTTTNIPVQIICATHGIFLQLPKIHLKGCDCPKCSINIRAATHAYTTEQFIVKATTQHGNRYDYSLVGYINSITKISITCNKCGNVFSMNPAAHLYGQGCPPCGDGATGLKRRVTQQDFVERLKQRYGDSLLYDKVQYHIMSSLITLTCKIHGDFEQRADYLLNNKIACPECVLESKRDVTNRPGNYSVNQKLTNPTKSAYVYLIKIYDNNECFYKIGVTVQSVRKRFPRLVVAGYHIEIINLISTTLEQAVLMENQKLQQYKSFKYLPLRKFGGYTECVSVCPSID